MTAEPNPDDYRWCLHCEIGFHKDDGVWNNDLLIGCPTIGCDGGWRDFWDWTYVAACVGYPELPEEDRIYPLYPDSRVA